MAMNKKERKLIEDLQAALSLRWTDKVEKDVPIPKSCDGLVIGYTYNSYVLRAERSCSDSVHHALGRTDRTTSQRGIAMYSSKLLALMAMRNEVELRIAKELRDIDRLIEAEKQAT